MMEVRKLRGNASVIPSGGGSTKTYKQRESGIFFASAGFAEDFDLLNYTKTVIEPSYARNSKYMISSNGEKYSYIGKKNINRRKVYCFGYKDGYDATSSVGVFAAKIQQDEAFYLSLEPVSAYTAMRLYKKSSLTTGIGQIGNDENISVSKGIIEACFDLDEKKVTVWVNGSKISFNIPDNLIDDSALIDRIYWGNLYSYYWSELALSDGRIGNICIKPMLTNAIGDSNDFSDDSSNSPVLGKYSISTAIQASDINSKQLYKFSVPDLPNNSKIDSVFVHSSIKGDGLSEMNGIIKIGEDEFEGEAIIPSSQYYSIASAYLKTNPISGEALTADDLAILQGGCKILGVQE